MNIPPNKKTSWGKSAALIVGLLCFSFHFLLIFHHVYYDASKNGNRTFPKAHLEFPQRWHSWIDFNRWDSGHYERIIVNGYRDPDAPDTPQPTIQWFPGYPLIAKPIIIATGAPPTFIFSLLSVAFTAAFWIILWTPGMVACFGKKVLALFSILTICWPGAFYWFAGMTEPLVALLLLLVLYFWLNNNLFRVAVTLAYATSVKQPFVPIAIAIMVLERLRSQRGVLYLTGMLILSLSGFIAFGLYSLICFNDFFASTNYMIRDFHTTLDIRSLFDLSHYAANIGSLNGTIAVISMILLLSAAVTGLNRNRTGAVLSALLRKKNILSLSPIFLTGSLAAAYTALIIFGSAYKMESFMSVLRLQTPNICIFLLAAGLLKHLPVWKLIVILVPVCWILIFWQNQLTVNYWLWQWIA